MTGIVLATDPIHPTAAAIIDSAEYKLVVAPNNSMDVLKPLMPQAEGLIVRTKLPNDALEGAVCLRGIVRHGVGLDFIPMRRAAELAIPVANVPGANAQSVAEYVFAAIFELTRRLGGADAALRANGWWNARAPSERSIELSGKRLGVIGLGNIGRRVAGIGAAGFGMHVVGTQRRLETMPDFVRAVDMRELFAISDFVVLCCPLTPQTERMVDSVLLDCMKRTSFLINAARGQLIDDAALVSALREQRIAGAALDVFWQQPLADDHPYRSFQNVLLTPHLAALTADSMERIGCGACEEMVRLLCGQRPLNLANPEIWPAAQTRWRKLEALKLNAAR